MELTVCHQCSAEIEGKGIHFRGYVFCSDECCEEFEEAFADREEPDLDDLEDDISAADDLGYRDDDFDDADDFENDDLEIRPEDF